MATQHTGTDRLTAVITVADRMWRGILVNWLAASPLLVNPVRASLMRFYGIKTGTHGIRPGCYFAGRDIAIGAGTFINYRCFFDGSAPIRIGKNCGLGMEVLFCTSTHVMGPATERAGRVNPQPITVGDGCWIGARSVILPGVTIGDGCVIAAGAVVNKDCAANGMYAGVPARRIKELPVEE
jgi:acetyltransferase-like isoleucine patch superfamily enzyme